MMQTALKSPAKKTQGKNSTSKKKVKFEFTAQPYNEVYVAGSFNNWEPKEIRLEEENADGVFTTYITLPKGRHEYKFIVNDVWTIDPSCPDWTPNNQGSLNSVIEVE